MNRVTKVSLSILDLQLVVTMHTRQFDHQLIKRIGRVNDQETRYITIEENIDTKK